jgi:outer membrane phospholipase A
MLPFRFASLFALTLTFSTVALLPSFSIAQSRHPLAKSESATIRGTVTTISGNRLAGASLSYRLALEPESKNQPVPLKHDGTFSFIVDPGRYVLTATLDGYESDLRKVTVGSGENVRIASVLSPTKYREPSTLFLKESYDLANDERFIDSENFNLSNINYFLFGGEGLFSDLTPDGSGEFTSPYFQQVKFRVAIRYTLYDWLSRDERIGNSGVYFGFEQTSHWHLYEDNAPFHDNNYQPGGYVRWSAFDHITSDTFNNWMPSALPSFQIGIVHQSNGRSREANRSWNRLAGRIEFGRPGLTRWHVAVGGWLPFSVSPDNPDLEDYAGLGEIELHGVLGGWNIPERGYGRISTQLVSAISPSGYGFRNIEANLLYHLKGESDIKPSVLFQAFYGYGENLLNYRDIHASFRLGIAIVR